ncbi:centrosomal protein of 57 kDa isoform X2 [Bufo bufo]|uniref:centrosomal protein of 57 kDa isoform X2 n=1 Tax=Bufo bufo TaxID=8384 RepID=UPI001ABE8EAA|nr:centrosomal protein of 57 kDa isoform X2 [Bufo bufo]
MAAAASFQSRTLHSPLSKGASSKDAFSSTSYTSYPRGDPSDLQCPPSRLPLAYPESNGRAIMSALRNLQEKIRQLELERIKAEDNLRLLSKESTDYKHQLETQTQSTDHVKDDMSRQNRDLSRQLSAAKSRCGLLEKQLEYMKKMVQNAETERNSVLAKQVSLEGDQALEKSNLQAKLEKLDKLEQEYLKLTTMQVLAENKIRDIEQKLREEEHQRKLVQEKAAQLQTGLETNRILLKSLTPPTKQVKIKRRASHGEKKADHESCSHTQPHYRLSLGDVPFVAGKSTAPSHSVRANVQHVLHLMKQHHKVFCNDRVVSDQPLEQKESSVRWTDHFVPSSSSYRELSEVLLTLEDEFGQMSFDHQELVKQINEAHSDRLREDLEEELEALVRRMEAKADQITKVRKHQAMLGKLLKESRMKKKASCESSKTIHSGKDQPASKHDPNRTSPGEKSKKSLQLLREMQTLRGSLQRDDVHWE